jgi:RimJ/RimL family protein N-acetyltransferase
MDKLFIKADKFIITEFNESMAESIRRNSLDEDTRRFVPDEVFETIEEAQVILQQILGWYEKDKSPLIYAIVLNNGVNIGYVQAVPVDEAEWEIGYHVAKEHTGNGYATNAVKAFLPVIMKRLSLERITGLCHLENIASSKVLEKCGFVLEYSGVANYQGELQHIRRYNYYAV